MYSVQFGGYYWSATPGDSNYAYRLLFLSTLAYSDNFDYRYFGFAVRLVQDLD